MNRTLIVFDIDDTLTITAAVHIKAFISSLLELGVKQMDTRFGEYKHHTDSYISRVIYEKETGKPYTAEIKKQFEKLLTNKLNKEKIVEMKGASSLVKNIQDQKELFACFATGSLRRPAIRKLETIGIDIDASILVASDEIEERENIVSTAIRQAKSYYGVNEFDRIISVGDGLWDLKTANNLGLNFIGVGEKNKATLLKHGCAKHFNDFQHIELEKL